jgi:hypothetical protein
MAPKKRQPPTTGQLREVATLASQAGTRILRYHQMPKTYGQDIAAPGAMAVSAARALVFLHEHVVMTTVQAAEPVDLMALRASFGTAWRESGAVRCHGEWTPNVDAVTRETAERLVSDAAALESYAVALDEVNSNKPEYGQHGRNFQLPGQLVKGLTPTENDILEILWAKSARPTLSIPELHKALWKNEPKKPPTLICHLKNLRRKLIDQSNGRWDIHPDHRTRRLVDTHETG